MLQTLEEFSFHRRWFLCRPRLIIVSVLTSRVKHCTKIFRIIHYFSELVIYDAGFGFNIIFPEINHSIPVSEWSAEGEFLKPHWMHIQNQPNSSKQLYYLCFSLRNMCETSSGPECSATAPPSGLLPRLPALHQLWFLLNMLKCIFYCKIPFREN